MISTRHVTFDGREERLLQKYGRNQREKSILWLIKSEGLKLTDEQIRCVSVD